MDGAAMDSVLKAKCEDLQRGSDRMSYISSHDSLVILKNSLGSTRVQYILRASPCASHPALVRFDELQRAILGRISNCELSDQHWMQANLPVRCGGLGIRSVALLAPSAFLASAAATLPTQTALLPVNFQPRDGFVEGVVGIWSAKYSCPTSDASRAVKQRSWDEASIQHALQCLLGSCSDDISKARLLAAQAPHSGVWLNAMPVSSCGLRLDDEAVRVAIGLRLGVNLCAPHGCPCGAMVDALGIHGLSCRRSAGRTSRHNTLNDIIFRACIRSGVPAYKEPTGLFLNDEKRTDGMLVPWKMGRCVPWDVTCPDTLAASHRQITAYASGAASERAAMLKHIKYQAIKAVHDFVPIAVETLGPINDEGMIFLRELGGRLSTASHDRRETSFLFQRVSVCMQRANAIAFRGSFSNLCEVTDD